jgi:poly-gamma-glutamate capsule biosynthesis protein CapA/YwtB (metallophosphatase superfamily)
VSVLTLIFFLAGDVMTGRGIDQLLPHPSSPILFEPFMRNAQGYVELAETVNGPLPRSVDFSYIWGEALAELERTKPDARVVNLETAVTRSEDHWPEKEIHYRMSPENLSVLKAARIDVCSLANNHVLDWGYTGLSETLATLRKEGVKTAGAGRNLQEAEDPAIVDIPGKGRLVVFSCGMQSSGIPGSWAASKGRAGVNLLPDLSEKTILRIRDAVRKIEKSGDIMVFSIHWGSNWGYEIPEAQRSFAHRLIDLAGIDIVHGHSSHHVKAIEVYRDRLILFGAGDLLNDYEGIEGYEEYRGELGLMYFPELEVSTGRLLSLRMIPTRMRRFRLTRASPQEVGWLRDALNREGKKLNTKVEESADGALELRWE